MARAAFDKTIEKRYLPSREIEVRFKSLAAHSVGTFAEYRAMLSTVRLCRSVSSGISRPKSVAVSHRGRKTVRKPLAASFLSRHVHTSNMLLKARQALEPIKPPMPEIELDGEIVPQSRLNDILAHLGEDPEIPILQETEMDLEPFVVNEVLDVGRHTKILPGTPNI
jgi:hypothetical protein